MSPFRFPHAIGLAAALATAGLAHADYFRYVDDSGKTVLNDTLPAEYAHRGYEVIDTRGRVIETVPPVRRDSLSQPVDERAIKEAEADRLRDDLILLTSYASIDEIAAHRDRKLDELVKQLEFVGLEESNLRKTYNAVSAQAADYERRGEAVPDSIHTRLREYEVGLTRLEALRAQYQAQLDNLDATFQDRIERYESLKSGASEAPALAK